MIFVTVGTHEQQFNRLLEEIDHLKGQGTIKDDVIIQSGYSTYSPKYCQTVPFLSQNEMDELINHSRIVITHGGPASFLKVLEAGKIPIVVPRQKKFQEHVNDHQVDFCKKIDSKMKNIIAVFDIKDLENCINNYEEKSRSLGNNLKSNNKKFCNSLEREIQNLFL